MMNNCNSNSYASRNRRGLKQPVYTSDKRAKFTQRENKKWIRFLTVLGYIFFVSLPAISLSVYYVYVWDPGYITKFPQNESLEQSYPPKYFEQIKIDNKPRRDVDQVLSDVPPTPKLEPHLENILREGKASMESSAEYRSPEK